MSTHIPAHYSRKPCRPLPIRWWTRFGDARDARRCARANPPRPDAHADAAPSTSRIEAIRHRALDSTEAERLLYLGDTRTDRIRLAAIEAELQTASATLTLHQQERDGLIALPVPQDRRSGESDLPMSSVVRRRAVENNRIIGAAGHRVSQAQAQLERLAAEFAEVSQRIAERLAAAQSRAARLLERDRARIDHYRSALVAAHADGALLNLRFTAPSVEIPAWVTTGQDSDLGART